MGMSVNTYVGPTVKTDATYMKKVEKFTCSNSDCIMNEMETKSKFCAECGSPVKPVETSVEVDVNLCTILYEIGCDEDYLTNYEYIEQYIPNMGDFGKYLDADSEDSLSLTDLNIEEELHNFMQDENIKKLLEYCNEHSIKITIDYEVVTFWS